MASERISVVVPTLNEAENIPLLVPRLAEALCGKQWELILVDDDSRDNTKEICARLAQRYPVKLLVREKPTHGLSGAVLHGFRQAGGDVLVVMDADLQHPPEKVPDLVQVVTDGTAEFALGSRYEAGGSTEGEWGAFRKLNSYVATALARPFSGGVKDPMSGFFALKRSTYQRAQRLSPLGYKIALELMCKCQVDRVKEIPIRFGLRQHGQSKLSLKQQFHYLQHLSRLYDFQYPRAAPVLKFLVVLAIGGALAAGIYFSLLRTGMNFSPAILIAYLAHLVITAIFHARYIVTQREFLVTRRPWSDFVLIAAGEMVAVAIVAGWLQMRLEYALSGEIFAISFAAGTVVRYILRKELMLDVRGLRHDPRAAEAAAESSE